MKKKLVERRIFTTPSGKYLVTYKKEGKPNAKILNTLLEAQEFRNKTDSKLARKRRTDGHPEVTEAVEVKTKRPYNRKAKPVFQQVALPNMEGGQDSFMLIIAKNTNVLDSIVAKFL